MKRFTSLLGKRSNSSNSAPANGDSLEADIARGVRLFCESGGPNNTGEEVLYLPVIVDSAESSPGAAKEAAQLIRKFLSKDNFQRAYVQYNAIMLIRILADNPGQSFTKNIDTKFVATVKELLRDGRDMSVQQILRETLDTFEAQKAHDETLSLLINMWTSEKVKWSKKSGNNIGSGLATNGAGPRTLSAPPFAPGQSQAFYRPRHHHHERALPPPQELASRIEEAKTSSKLLTQVVQSTPPQELLGNDLVKEFVERCQSASRSIQSYISADNPAPDEDTLLTLIETNDGLATALSKHQRGILQARKFSSAVPPAQPPRPPVEAPTPAPVQAPPVQDFVSPLNSPRQEPPAVAPAGPPPRLGMPKRVEKMENPFDDSHQTNGSSSHAGPSKQPDHLTPGQAAHAATHGDSTDDEDSPAPTRQYRF